MKNEALLSLFLLVGMAPLAHAQTLPGAQYDYKKFGFWTWFAVENRTNAPSNAAAVPFTVEHFSFNGAWEISRGIDRDDLLELGWRLERHLYTNRLVFENNYYGIDLSSWRHTALSPWFGLFIRGGILAQYHVSSDIASNDFADIVSPAFAFITASNQAASAASNARLSGARFTLKFEAGMRWAPKPWFEAQTSVRAQGGIDTLAVTGSDAIPSLYLHYGLGVTQRVTFTFGLVQPYLEYRLGFLENENNLLGTSRMVLPVRHFFILGVMFKFSLLCFG